MRMLVLPSRHSFLRSGLAMAALALLASPVFAIDEEDLLDVDAAFALEASAPTRDRIEARWKIAPGYYLYKHRMSLAAKSPSTVLGEATLPAGKRKHDEFFGDVETYRGEVTASALLQVPTDTRKVTIEVRYQGCADVGVCYPPERRTLEVALPADSIAAPAAAGTLPSFVSPSASAALGFDTGAAALEAGPLPEAEAFRVDALVDPGSTADEVRAAVRFTMPPGYYLYRDKTRFALATPVAGVTTGTPVFPPGRPYKDEHFGNVTVYFDQVEVELPLTGNLAGVSTLPLQVSFQGCQDGGICYPPMQRTLELPIAAALAPAGGTPPVVAQSAMADPARSVAPAASPASGTVDTSIGGQSAALAEDSRIAKTLADAGRGWALLAFFGFGLLLAFTPCVLPMIPILSGIIAGAGPGLSTRRALLLSLVYVLSSAVVFTIAGVAAGLAGANLQAAFQTPWILALFAAIFVALSLSMFGWYELQLPTSLQTRLATFSNRQRPGSLAGVAVMGALSALIVGPCVAPPLAGAVLYISQTHDAVFGGLALFLLALGMGAPLLVFGATAGRLLPRAGAWMDAVKAAFGVVFLLLAVWMLERILPPPVTLFLFGVVLVGAGVGLRALDPLPPGSPGLARVWKSAGVLLLLIGAIEVVGALAGSSDYLRPLAGLRSGAAESEASVAFQPIRSVADLDRELDAADAVGKPLLLDFYADWCVACKEMDRDTFTDAAVIEAASGYVRIKVDVTANDAVDKALLKRFGLIGPPATLFFVDGEERRALRLLGFEKPTPFRARLEQASARAP